MDFQEFVQTLPENLSKLIIPLHEAILERGCKYRLNEKGDIKEILYSMRDLRIRIEPKEVYIKSEYDIRAFINLYQQTDNEYEKELLFNGVKSCSYCINDKCTTFLMGKHRTIEFGDRKKKLCGPYRHNIKIPIKEQSIPICLKVVNMVFEYTYPYMHKDIFYKNEVTYNLTVKEEFYIVGYIAWHNSLSKSDEELVSSVLSKDSDGKRKIDALLEAIGQADDKKYIGAIDKFVDGNHYEFIFGVATDKKPETLPEDVVCRKIRSGEWAVYNSSAGDYKSIWREFTKNFYNKEHKGYDTSRIPFEYYDENGRFYDVHIPVDADMPADSSRTVVMHYMPDTILAGFSEYAEHDYPLYRDLPFNPKDRLIEAFPHADKIIELDTHAIFGKPIRHDWGVAVDELTTVPEDIGRIELKGGYWLLEGRKHFNGGWCEYPFGRPMNFRMDVDDAHHPRAWLVFQYVGARGGYTELGNPANFTGKKKMNWLNFSPSALSASLKHLRKASLLMKKKGPFILCLKTRKKELIL